MSELQKMGSIYFLTYLGNLFFDFLVWLNINPLLSSILSFISILLKFPKDCIDLVLTYTQLGQIVLLISGVCFLKTVYNIFIKGELCTSY